MIWEEGRREGALTARPRVLPLGPASRRRKPTALALGRAVLLAVLGLYLAITVGPLVGLTVYAPISKAFTPDALQTLLSSLRISLYSSAIATCFAFLLGLPAALCLARMEFPGKKLVNALIELPIALPPLVIGVALLLTLGRNGICGRYFCERGIPLSFTPPAVIIAQFVVAAPFLVRIAKAAIEQVPRSLEEASYTLGRGAAATYLRVTLPLARRGIGSGLVTCWARAISEFGATAIFAGSFPGRTQTMPLAIYSTLQYDVETAVAISICMLLLSAVSFVVAHAGLKDT